MNQKDIESIAKITCPKCIGCKFLDTNPEETAIFCNKREERITSDFINCKDKETTNVVETISKPLENVKHEAFCQEYLIDYNKTQAAIRAGYSKNSAKEQGYRLFTNDHIQERVAQLQIERNKRVEIKQDDVLRDIEEVKNRCMQSVQAQIWDNRLKRYVPKVVMIEGEDGEEIQAAVYEFDPSNSLKALELLGKHTGAFKADNDQKKPDAPVTVIQLPDNGRT